MLIGIIMRVTSSGRTAAGTDELLINDVATRGWRLPRCGVRGGHGLGWVNPWVGLGQKFLDFGGLGYVGSEIRIGR